MPFQCRAIKSISARATSASALRDEVERHFRLEHQLLDEEVEVSELELLGNALAKASKASLRLPCDRAVWRRRSLL